MKRNRIAALAAAVLLGMVSMLSAEETPSLYEAVPANALPLRIGADQSGQNVFRGDIGAVRLYNRALSPEEVKAQAAASADAPSGLSGIIGEWLHPKTPDKPIPSNPKFDLSNGGAIEAWIKPDAGMTGRIVDKITPGGMDGYLLDTHPGDAVRFIVGAETLTCPLPHRNAWTHVVATIDADGQLALFCNGIPANGQGASGGTESVAGCTEGPATPLTLWYRQPAERWTEASILGNGRLGAMVWGGAKQERIDLNEDTLWSGEPYDNLNPKGLKSLPEIRRLLVEGKDLDAKRLVESDMNGKYNQSYQPLGDLTISFQMDGTVSEYRRELDLGHAVARTEFVSNGVRYIREAFVSQPAQAVVINLTCDASGKLSFTASLNSQLHHTTKASENALCLTGRCPAHVDPNYMSNGKIVYDDAPEGRGMRFETRLAVLSSDGQILLDENGITAKDCGDVTLVLVAATSYNGPHKSPSREGKDPAALCKEELAALSGETYAALRAAHVTDYQALFGRVTLNLGPSEEGKLPTDVRVKKHRPGNDPGLAALYYQFGRYLLIASSRPGTQPANLQGIWNHEMRPPWSANWTLNCNAEINYWPVETANLSECHLPLIELTKELSVDGAHIAEGLYGARGWMAHHNTDIWRQAGPVAGDAVWSIFQVGGAWLCQHLWEHYAFTGDVDYLRDVWPTLSGAARFYLEYMMEEPSHGWRVTGPDTNFENPFRKPDGQTGAVCMGPTGSMQMVRELLQNCAHASQILTRDEDLRAEIEKTLPQLPPMQISPTTGELQEWLQDWQRTADCQVLSSWGAVCGAQITPRGTPELAAALRKIFDGPKWWRRGLVGSWQGAFQANVYARLHDGDTALEVVDTHLRRSVNPNLSASFSGVEWEIDGNLGHTAAIGEMLLQSHVPLSTGPLVYEIELLPALPKAWPSGSVTGLRARGGFEVDLRWKDGQLDTATVRSVTGTGGTIRYQEKTMELNLKPGETIQINGMLTRI